MKRKIYSSILLAALIGTAAILMSSSHREAPLILGDPTADNTDVYAFRNPDNPEKVTIIANYIPFQLPQGGPNFYHFGENVRYEIHVDNNVANNTYASGDDIVYRFTFKRTNEDPTTFFDIRLGKENLKTTYTLERSMDGGVNFTTVVTNGVVPPPNIGPRSISSEVGLKAPDYNTLMQNAITTASSGEKVFCGPVDDPFFVDVAGAFDLGDVPRTGNNGKSGDGLKCKNVSTIALQIDISTLQKDHKPSSQAKNILDGDYVIGVWASASRRKIKTLNTNGTETYTGAWVQVSRLGMPLTNEVVNPIGSKDLWNSLTPYQEAALNDGVFSHNEIFDNYLYNPELALYMDDSQFGPAIPALTPLRIQTNSLGMFDFRNTKNGLFALKGSAAVAGTALDDAIAGKILLPGPGRPRSVDLYPIFRTGVPNLSPYQLATGKPAGKPLAPGKPFVNNFLPNGGDMLRLNMAVPATPRNSPDFSSEGLLYAAVLGLTDPRFNANSSLQSIPNMDGFPNGRRLEDDVTRIELQAVSGIVLAVLGLPYEDPARLGQVISYTTGVEKNDTTLRATFPFEQTPWPGTCNCAGIETGYKQPAILAPSVMKMATPELFMVSAPNPFANNTTIRYRVETQSQVTLNVYSASGNLVSVLVDQQQEAGTYNVIFNSKQLPRGVYFVKAISNGEVKQSLRVIKN